MAKTRKWAVVLGGLLTLIGVIGLYLTLTRGNDLYFDLWSSGFRGAASLLLAWNWCLAAGLVLTHLGNGAHPVGHSYELIDGMTVQPSRIYGSVTATLTEHEVPGHRVSVFNQHQRGLLSARRCHLRVTSGYFRFELCAAPFGKDFGVSWRCYGRMALWERALISIPILGWLAYFLCFRYTTYIEDRGLLFQSAVHRAVRAAITDLQEERGLRILSGSEFQPILTDMFRRWR